MSLRKQCLIALSLTCAMSGSAISQEDNGLTRAQQAAKTEVWEPVPAVVTANKGEVPSDAIALFGEGLNAWTAMELDGGESLVPWRYQYTQDCGTTVNSEHR